MKLTRRRFTASAIVIGCALTSMSLDVAQAQESGGEGPGAKKIYVLAAFSCSGKDMQDRERRFGRFENGQLILDAFAKHVPQSKLIKYGEDDSWRDELNVRYSDAGFKKADLREAIEICPAGPQDTIVVYWNGHGGGSSDQPGEHLLVMAGDEPVSRAEVVSWIEAKNARLSVLITDTCAKGVAKAADETGPMGPPEVVAPLFEELFLKPHGWVNLSSAVPGEYAVGDISFGSYFTMVLAGKDIEDERVESEVGYLNRHSDSRKSWQTVVRELQTDLSSFYKTLNPNGVKGQMDQHIWVIELPGGGPVGPPTGHHHRCRLLRLLRR